MPQRLQQFNNMENSRQNKSSKSTLWKVGMTIASYYLFPIIILIIYTIIGGLVIFSSGNIFTDLQKIDSQYSYLTSIIMIGAGITGIWYGIRHIAKKSSLTQKDSWNIIFWFLFIQGIFLLFPSAQDIAWSFVILNLSLSCAAIYLFSRKYSN